MAADINKCEAKVLVRKIELEAYSGVVSALRVQGDLTDKGKAILEELRNLLGVSDERHKAEIRRASSDDYLEQLAQRANGCLTYESWLTEGKRILPPLPRIDHETAFTRLANAASKKQVKLEMAKFYEAKDLLERAIKKHEESRVTVVESDRLDTKRRLAELTPGAEASTSEEPKTKVTSAASKKRVRVCSPPHSTADGDFALAEPSVKPKKVHSEKGSAKKQRLRMSPSGSSSVQENVPAEDFANASLSPVKISGDIVDSTSPLATPGQLARNVDLFTHTNHGDQRHSLSNDVSNFEKVEKVSHKSPSKSPKQPKEKKPKQSKKKNSLKSDSLGDSMTNFSASPPVTLSGVATTRPAHVNVIQQPTHGAQSHSQPSTAAVVISSTNHGQQVVVSSPTSQAQHAVHTSPGKAAQSSYHNYAPPHAPLSINPMRLVGRAGPGAAISTSATASPPSVAVNTATVRHSNDPASANIPLIRLTPSNQTRPPLIVATSGSRPASLTPGAPGVPVLTIRSSRPTLTPVTAASTASVKPSIVIHQATPSSCSQPALVMRRVGPAPTTTTTTTPLQVSVHSTVPSSAATASAPTARPVIISSSTTSGANTSNVVVINKPNSNINLQQQPPSRSTVLTGPATVSVPNQPTRTHHSSVGQQLGTGITTVLRSDTGSVSKEFGYAPSHFPASSRQDISLYNAQCDLASPPAIGAESVVETSHELANGTAFESSNSAAGLDLLQQAAAVIADSSGNVELGNFMVDKDLDVHDLGHYENVVDTYSNHHHTNSIGQTAAGDVPHGDELYNEDLMMAIMNNNTAPAAANGQHGQSQPS